MYDDLVQVIAGAAKILATTLSRAEKPLYNYILVPFHDPRKYFTRWESILGPWGYRYNRMLEIAFQRGEIPV